MSFLSSVQRAKREIKRAGAKVGQPSLPAQDALPRTEPTSLYRSLPKDSIRLVTVQFTNGVFTGLRLDTWPRRRAPRYDALSYCWGEDLETIDIDCNGLPFQVRKNLKDFLMASANRNSPLRPLWIDAICLNQADVEEKHEHIPLMDKVYINASRTIVWLGYA